MERGTTMFLKGAVFLIGITVASLCVFWLPNLAKNTAEMFPEYAFLQYPVLLGLYATSVPFFFALYQSLILLKLIEKNNAFSLGAVMSLKYIKLCATVISSLYILGSLYLLLQNALHPGIAIIGLTIIFASYVIAVFSAVLQKLLKSAIDIKTENDLTV
ncbi:DUF2975 domain-containing protein [Bacillus sp. FJAT-45066]|uniref:DUF2975 domain-containing protein n=1 Tax=Bacillus sp. FJAT-45066 TaxID=2011010 RepID=UPI000BB8F39D|nr:DUF2975 domain-containing protein [Bacillus sp. FJAT-45066]